MTRAAAEAIRAAQCVLPCATLDDTLAFFTERLGFSVEAIFPADDPAVAVIAAHGVRLRLERGAAGPPGTIRLLCADPAAVAGGITSLTAPNGTRIELVPATMPIVVPPLRPDLVLSRAGDDASWSIGRAGMRYRDLLPGRLGGRFIASHIAVPDGGPVPDYVHYHRIRFQMIFCRRGWVRVVYEDQGPPFVMAAGDCVLQPPEIRHRVLESSSGLEVIEIGCPALHETLADPATPLPTPRIDPSRAFGGQRFLRHVAAEATWRPWRWDGFVCRDTGIAAATAGLAGAEVVRPSGADATPRWSHRGELLFMTLLAGGATLVPDGRPAQRLAAGDAVAVPAGMGHALAACSPDLELLEVALPAAVEAWRDPPPVSAGAR